jgi:hypothetical protein
MMVPADAMTTEQAVNQDIQSPSVDDRPAAATDGGLAL